MIQKVQGAVGTILAASGISTESKEKLQALVQASEGEDSEEEGAPAVAAYESKSGAIFDLLANLKDETEGKLSDVRKAEMNAQHNYEMLAQSLNDAISQAGADLTHKKAEKGNAGAKKGAAE